VKKALKNWDTYANQIRSLADRLGFKGNTLEFLAYAVELESGKVYDKIKGVYENNPNTLHILLAHYSNAIQKERTGKLVKFGELPGGYAYENAFQKRAIFPLARMFENNPEKLVEAAKLLGGFRLEYGDVSVEIPALPMVPLTYVLWKGDSELNSSASILFDASASNYLPTEDIAILAQLATMQLKHANYRILKQNFK